ncbi:MAG: hypothetical protein QF767_12620, partial [Alphaproteobacteria bacterium]|nr:hypothetical protein [Alphaproteobacteria bacterium]
MTASLPPALIFFAGALLVALAPGRLRPALTMLVPLVGGWNLWHVAESSGLEVALFDIRLELVRADKLALLFGILSFAYLSARRLIARPGLAVLAVLGLTEIYVIGYGLHRGYTHTAVL